MRRMSDLKTGARIQGADAQERIQARIRAAEELQSLVSHPAVREWFQIEERARLEMVLSVPAADRDMAIAGVQALRGLRAMLEAILAGRDRNLQRLDKMTERTAANG